MNIYDFANFVPEKEKLTAIILTLNEEKNIERCLNSLKFVDEVIVIDSGSTDKTLEIVQKFSKVSLISTKWYGFVKNKQLGIDHASHDWILWIDADEEVPDALAKEWIDRINAGTFHETAAIDFPRKTFFLGHWVKHSGWYPGRVIRFFHKKRAYLSDNILHEGVIPKEGYTVEHFNTDLLHYSYSSMYQYFDKMNKYGLAGAK